MLRYINSKDVADYLRKIDYRFSPLERAYLVYHSQKHTLDQKKQAWERISEEYPDEIFYRKDSDFNKRPLAEILRGYITFTDKLVEECKTPGAAVWKFEYLTEEGESWLRGFDSHFRDDIQSFSSYERCLEYVHDGLEGGKRIYGTAKKFRIIKSYLDTERYIELTFNANGELLDIDALGLDNENDELSYLLFFYDMWFQIPTPFKRGDIVVSHDFKRNVKSVFVLSELTSWDSKAFKKNGYANGARDGRDRCNYAFVNRCFRACQREGCEEDMSFRGYTLIEGDLEYCTSENYIDLEYYHGDEDDDYKRLKVVSEYEKGNIALDAVLKFERYFTLKSETDLARYDVTMSDIIYANEFGESFLNDKKS